MSLLRLYIYRVLLEIIYKLTLIIDSVCKFVIIILTQEPHLQNTAC